MYMVGSTSEVLDIDRPDLARFPRFAEALKHRIEFILNPGDMLFLPGEIFRNYAIFIFNILFFFPKFSALVSQCDCADAVRIRQCVLVSSPGIDV